MEFPDHLTARLLRLSEHQWRSLRTKVRWAYTKYNYNAVGILSEYMRYLPEDATIWLDYAKSVNNSRKLDRLAERRREKKRKAKVAKVRHKKYMCKYMREYRQGRRRRAIYKGT